MYIHGVKFGRTLHPDNYIGHDTACWTENQFWLCAVLFTMHMQATPIVGDHFPPKVRTKQWGSSVSKRRGQGTKEVGKVGVWGRVEEDGARGGGVPSLGLWISNRQSLVQTGCFLYSSAKAGLNAVLIWCRSVSNISNLYHARE